jgi:hypothetical protein
MVLIEVFETIELDLSVIDSNSGKSNRVNFKLDQDLQIKYKIER